MLAFSLEDLPDSEMIGQLWPGVTRQHGNARGDGSHALNQPPEVISAGAWMHTCNADGGQALWLRHGRILPHERLAVQEHILHSGAWASLHRHAKS